jgi:RNA polymerase sigma-70 factor (ECF subfamily)
MIKALLKQTETEMDDSEIVRLLFERDEAALEHLRQKYGAKCYAIAYGVLKNRQDAEEAVSDAYFAIWNSIPPEKPDILCAYLYKLVRNLSLHIYEARGAEKRRANAEAAPISELDHCVSSDFDLHRAYEERELSRLVNRFLLSLKEDDRRMFLCRYFANMEYRQIAKKYGFTQSRAKMSVKRSREKLRQLLISEGYYNEK